MSEKYANPPEPEEPLTIEDRIQEVAGREGWTEEEARAFTTHVQKEMNRVTARGFQEIHEQRQSTLLEEYQQEVQDKGLRGNIVGVLALRKKYKARGLHIDI